jgi:hypothetical protein
MSDFDASPEVLGKIAASLGLSEAAPPQEVADAPVSETGEQPTDGDGLADFEWDGWKIQGPPEKVESLKKSTLLHKDYTQKTQEIAETRKAIDHQKALAEAHQSELIFVQSIADEQRELAQLDRELKGVKNVDISNLSQDQLIRASFEIAKARERRTELAESINNKRAQFANSLQARVSELRAQSKEQAFKSLPNFTEETYRTTREYAKSQGLSEREVDNLFLDTRAIVLSEKARRWDELGTQAAKGGKQASDSPDGVLRPGVAGERMPKETTQKLNFRKALKSAKTSHDKANVIEGRLAGLFGGHK